jgi:hypothetical protein
MIKRNNPLNIRAGKSCWMGAVSSETGSFVTFLTVAHGYRAAWKLLANYHRYYRLWTLRQVINRWAPPQENNTSAYVRHVAALTRLDPDALLPHPAQDIELWVPVLTAMTVIEQGMAWTQVPQREIRRAWQMAFETQG